MSDIDDEGHRIGEEPAHDMGAPPTDGSVCGARAPHDSEWCELPPEHAAAQLKAGRPIKHFGRYTAWEAA
jgi:hypothetical protein